MDKILIKKNITEGVRVGLIAFFICFLTISVVALFINFLFLDEINRVLNGSLSMVPKPSFANFLMIVSVILNFLVFNNGSNLENGGNLHIGLLIFIALPVIAFIIADRRDNKKSHFNSEDMIIYGVSSGLFSFVLYLFSWITKGNLLGIEVNFTKFSNLIMTFIIIVALQFFIGLNYNKAFSSGIKKTRLLLRILIGLGLIMGTIGLLFVFGKYINNIFIILSMTILLLPNVAIYIMYTFMGASMQFGDQLQKLMAQVGVDISFATLPFGIRIVCIVIFFVVVFVAVWRLEKEQFLEELFLFATSFSLISLIFAYMTKMNLGFVKNLLDVQFGFDYVFAFVVPFVIILMAGLIVLLTRYMIKEIKQ